eukprot:15432050-Alexandrium_andersonii.AAC.1
MVGGRPVPRRLPGVAVGDALHLEAEHAHRRERTVHAAEVRRDRVRPAAASSTAVLLLRGGA